jgi:hypothetical protein
MAKWYDDPPEDDDSQDGEDTNPVKSLRGQLKKVLADNEKLKADNAGLQKSVREASIRNFFRDREINPKLAKYVPQDVDPTEENLLRWVEEDGELFGIKPTAEKPAEGSESKPGSEGDQQPQEGSQELVAAGWNQIAGSTQTAMPPGKETDLLGQMTSAPDMAALIKVIEANGGNIGF